MWILISVATVWMWWTTAPHQHYTQSVGSLRLNLATPYLLILIITVMASYTFTVTPVNIAGNGTEDSVSLVGAEQRKNLTVSQSWPSLALACMLLLHPNNLACRIHIQVYSGL